MATEVLTQQSLREAMTGLKAQEHVALFYESPQDQFAAIMPFFQIGLEEGELCLYIADDLPREDVIEAMNKYGIDTELHLGSGALAVVGKKESYLRDNVFDPEEMIRFIEMTVKTARSAGFKGFRGVGEMTWTLGVDEGLERAIDYEVRLDRQFKRIDARILCLYNLNRFPPETILEVIRVHPRIIYNGKLCENDFYVRPSDVWSADRAREEVNRQLEKIHLRPVGV